MAIMSMFSAAHDGQAKDQLGESHEYELLRTLDYHLQHARGGVGIGSPGMGDDFEGCQEFEASMMEIMSGGNIQLERDQEARLLMPLTLDHPSLSS